MAPDDSLRALRRLILGVLLALPPGAGAQPCETLRYLPPREVFAGTGDGTVRAVDATGDGRLDLFALASGGRTFHAGVQRADGTFAPAAPLPTQALGLLAADFDRNGAEEGALILPTGPQLLRLRPDATLEVGPEAEPALPPTLWTLSDLDRDGRPEVLVVSGGSLLAYRLGGDGAFHGTLAATLAIGRPDSLVVGDFDGDGDDDVVATAENYPTHQPTAPMLWGDGKGGFTAGAPVWFSSIRSAAVADFDGDGREEFVYAAVFTGGSSSHWIGGLVRYDGVVGLAETSLNILSSPSVLLEADLDGDGRPDLAVTYPGGATLYRGLGGTFARAASVSGLTPTAAADLDGDGLTDLVGTDGSGVVFARNVCDSTLADISVPVVVSLAGENGVRFETEMTIDNLGKPVDLEVRYVPSFGGGGGTVTLHLGLTEQLFLPSALDALARAGLDVPAEGDRGGSLSIRVRGSETAYVSVTARVVAVGAGRGGVGFVGAPFASGLEASAAVGWLREAGGDRSNLAAVNLGGEKEGAVTLRVTLVSDEPGARRATLPEVVLPPGKLFQWNRALATAGMTGGWALVERVAGSAPFYAYGVVNDEGTGDGSFVPGVPAGRRPGRSWVVPAIVETDRYSSDLVLTNTSDAARTFSFQLVAETLTTGDRRARFERTLPPSGHLFVRDLVEELRRQGVAGIPARGVDVVGTLFAELPEAASSGVFLGARTSAPKPQGRYGVFYEASRDDGDRRYGVSVMAVRQDGQVRTNLAVVNLEEEPLTVRVLVRDPAAVDQYTGERRLLTLAPRGRAQIDSVLEALGTGLTRARVSVVVSGNLARFLAYGVVNEGARPGEGSDDGTFVAGR